MIFMFCALVAFAQQTPPTFHSGVRTVPVYATVRSIEGHFVPDLTREDFEIKDNGNRRDVTQFSREIVPITATVMLDMSGSREQFVEWFRDGTRAFVDALLTADKARIGTFGFEISISPRFTGDHKYLHRIVNEEIWPGGPTPLYEALDEAMTSLKTEEGRRVVLLMTDGYDSQYRARPASAGPTVRPNGTIIPAAPWSKADDIIVRARREGVMVYAVSYGQAQNSMGQLMGPPLSEAMKTIAMESGGGFRTFESSEQAVQAMTAVADELHHQYLLGFEPAVREHFPLKVWADCARCPRQDACDEVAVSLKL